MDRSNCRRGNRIAWVKKQQVIYKIEEKLKEDSDLDVYSELTENLDYYI